MATELLAVGTTAADSADVTITAGTSAVIYLKPAAGKNQCDPNAVVHVQFKDGSDYYHAFSLTTTDPTRRIDGDTTGAIVFRLSRPAGGPSCGVGRVS